MKKATVVIGSSAGDKKITEVIDVLWKKNVGATCHCISAKRAKKLEKMLEKWHKEMLKESTKKPSKKEKAERVEKPKQKEGTKKGKKNQKAEKREKGSKKLTKKQVKKIKASLNNQSFPLKAGNEKFESLEDLHEFIN